MSLLGLSSEILEQIIQYVAVGWLLGDPHNYGRLSKISKCCWRLHDIVHPYLYSALEINDWESQKCENFIRTLTAKPQLARFVKTFYCAEIIDDGPEISNLSEESKVWMQSILPDKTYGTELCDEWFNDLSLGSDGSNKWRDAMAAWFLVLFSDNLEEFNFEDFEEFKPYIRSVKPYIDSFLEDAAEEQRLGRSPCTLSSLKSVNVYQGESEKNRLGVGFDSILPFLKLKSVEELSVGNLNMGHRSLGENYKGFKLRALTLDCSRLDNFTLPHFLRCFSSLKKFHYHVREEAGSYSYNRNLCIWSVLRESLFSLRGCLEELSLQSETYSGVEWDAHYSHTVVGDEFQPIGSLSEFSNLKIITTNANILIGTERWSGTKPEGWHFTSEQCSGFAWSLPTSLEHLSIGGCSKAVFECLSTLFTSDRRTALPNLISISLSFREGNLYGSTAWEELAKMASERGVELKS